MDWHAYLLDNHFDRVDLVLAVCFGMFTGALMVVVSMYYGTPRR